MIGYVLRITTDKSMSTIDQLSAAIIVGNLIECRRLYSLITERPIELNLPEHGSSRDYIIARDAISNLINSEEKMELVWSTMTGYIRYYYISGSKRQAIRLLNVIIKLGYCPKKTKLSLGLEEDPILISNLRQIGWTIKVKNWCNSLIHDLMKIEDIITNIITESLEASILDNQFAIMEYLDLRGIKYRIAPSLAYVIRMAVPIVPTWDEALIDRNQLIRYLRAHDSRSSVHDELIEPLSEQLKTLSIDEIIECCGSYLTKKLIELEVELPTLNQVLSALLAPNHNNHESLTGMFLALAHHSVFSTPELHSCPERIDQLLILDLIKRLDIGYHKQEYGGILVVVVRYKLACLDEYRNIEFIHHLLELTISKTKPSRSKYI